MGEKIKTNSDTNFLKLIGMITMTLDHAGKMLFPDVMLLQIIGRITFPIFAYCLVVGSLYTRNINKYLVRLVISAILFQGVYTLYTLPNWKDTFDLFNIFFTLAIGLLCIKGIQEEKWWCLVIGTAAAFFLKIDYGAGGVLLIITFYLFRDRPLLSALLVASQLLFMQSDRLYFQSLSIQSYSIFSMPLLYMKTNFRPKINQYVFYIFYPMHFLVLYLISILIA